MTYQREIRPHSAVFKFAKDANKHLKLADAFLENHPEILFWTERNSSRAGLFYVYKEGLYSPVSIFEIDQMLLNYKPEEADILIPSLLSQSQRQETMNNIMRRRFFYRERFNPEGLVNFKNGFFDIEKEELIEHTMNIISTNQLPYYYDFEAECPDFLKALNDAVEGDLGTIMVIQEFVGYCLTRSTEYDKALFLIGAAGSGKSTVLNGIEAMLGKANVSNLSMDQICQPRFAGNFINKLANIDREIPKDISGYEESLKKIISGEDVTVDTKFIPSYNAKPFCKIIFAANDMPKISDSSDGIFRRMILIYFNNVVSNKNMDRKLRENVKKEGAGIFNWAYEGLKRLREREDFLLTRTINSNVEGMRLQNNAIYYFITECYEVDQDEACYITVEAMFERYINFCHEIHAKGIFKKPMFGKEIKKIFGKKILASQRSIGGKTCKTWTKICEKDKVKNNQGVVEWED